MIEAVIPMILGAWLLLSAVTTVACAALARAGLQEDRVRGCAPRQ